MSYYKNDGFIWIKENLSFKILNFRMNVRIASGQECEPGDIRQPLSRKAGPLQGVGHNQVIEEWGVLLPDLILLVYYPLLDRIIECTC